jgi:hypothetical protein
LALAGVVSGVSVAGAELATFTFVNGSEFDGAGVGASMTRDGITMSTVDVVGWDGARATENSAHQTSINSSGGLGIDSDGDDSGTNFEGTEAWEFTFDTDVYLENIEFNSMDTGNYFTLASLATPTPEFDALTLGDQEDIPYSLGTPLVTAGTTLRITFASGPGGDTSRITSLTVDTTLEPAAPGTLAVSAEKDLSNPDILGYNLGHFMKGTSTHDWWRYAGVNGARIFISPATLESSDDLIVGAEGEFGGDGVSDQASFLSRKAALRADPLNQAYINWTYFNDRFENKAFSGNRFTVNYALGKLRELDIDILVQATAKESHLIIADENDWAGKWELWQHYYAQAFYLGRYFDVHRFQMFNEPNHDGDLTSANWLMRLQLASDAIQSALSDVNSRYGKSLEPLVYGPVNSGGADVYNGSGWGDTMVANRHVNFLGETDPNYWVAHRYDYHEYNSTPSEFASNLSSLRSNLSADMSPETRFPVSISEFNVHTAGEFDTMADTIDYPAKYTRFGAISVNLADQFMKEFYCFKFGQVTKDGTYPVGKNGMHYVQNADDGDYEYGGATKAAEVWRLFIKALKPGGEQKKFTLDAGGNLDDLDIRATYVPDTGNYYVFIANEGSETGITIDTTDWGIPVGSGFQLEEVSESRYGTVRTWGTTSVDGLLLDGTNSAFYMPPDTVWLFTVPGQSLEPEERIAATEDAMVVDGVNASVNYGSAATLTVGNDATSADNRKAALIKFQLPCFYPPDIQLAVLSLTGKNASSDEANQAHVYGVDDDSWAADTLTWANAPNLLKGKAAGNLIADRVIDGQGDSAFIQGQLVFASTNQNERMIDVTAFLKGQVDREVSFLISQDPRWDVALPSLAVGDTQEDELVIQSAESGNGPQLKIVRLKDTDGDGLSDTSETTVFGTNPALKDSDDDGLTDGEEWFAGSDPNDAESRFELILTPTSARAMKIEWDSNSNRIYSVFRSPSLAELDWNEIHTISGTGTNMSYTDSVSGLTNSFYRLHVQ